jgi:cytochrome c
MVGGVLLGLYYQIKGLKKPAYDRLARVIADTVTVNKSMAVVLGVAPLLLINVLYTVYFYSANALTGHAWIMIVPLVTVAFLLTYLHKYTWDYLAPHKGLHIAIASVAALMFLSIPFIFLTNVNLMLFPNHWSEVKGFLSALLLPNVLPRYFHFMAACLAITGLFLVGYFRRTSYDLAAHVPGLSKAQILREGYALALGVSALQFLIGPLLMVTLPSHGFHWKMLLVIFAGAGIALPAMWLMWKEINASELQIGRKWVPIVSLFTLTILCMGTGRHIYRDQALANHKAQVQAKTAAYQAKVKLAQAEALEEAAAQAQMSPTERGEKVFKQSCAGCHAETQRLVGPPVTEMLTVYQGNPQGLQAWIRSPGKKRPDYPQMPAFGHLPAQDIENLTAYILSLKL